MVRSLKACSGRQEQCLVVELYSTGTDVDTMSHFLGWKVNIVERALQRAEWLKQLTLRRGW